MTKVRHNLNRQEKRKLRVRSKIRSNSQCPRLSVMRSNAHLSLQVINDEAGKTLLTVSDIGKDKKFKGSKTEKAIALAKDLAKKLKTKKIDQLVFDRGYYKYHGRVKAVAETLREQGIKI